MQKLIVVNRPDLCPYRVFRHNPFFWGCDCPDTHQRRCGQKTTMRKFPKKCPLETNEEV